MPVEAENSLADSVRLITIHPSSCTYLVMMSRSGFTVDQSSINAINYAGKISLTLTDARRTRGNIPQMPV